jgi:hypothetical protein
LQGSLSVRVLPLPLWSRTGDGPRGEPAEGETGGADARGASKMVDSDGTRRPPQSTGESRAMQVWKHTAPMSLPRRRRVRAGKTVDGEDTGRGADGSESNNNNKQMSANTGTRRFVCTVSTVSQNGLPPGTRCNIERGQVQSRETITSHHTTMSARGHCRGYMYAASHVRRGRDSHFSSYCS